MLVFLNIDCLVRQVSAAAGTAAGEPLCVPAFESVLDAWPRLRLVITSDCRYRMTIEQLRAQFAPPYRPRVIATTLLYGALATHTALTREQEILDWLRHADALHADWLALDDRGADFQAHADRLLGCVRFDRPTLELLHARLLQRLVPPQGGLPPRRDPGLGPGPVAPPGPDDPRTACYAERPDRRSSSHAGRPR